MMTLNNYTLRELYAMKDLMDRIDEMLDDYVTDVLKRVTGLQDLADEIGFYLHRAIKEDEENA